jgi:hypothetical protein
MMRTSETDFMTNSVDRLLGDFFRHEMRLPDRAPAMEPAAARPAAARWSSSRLALAASILVFLAGAFSVAGMFAHFSPPATGSGSRITEATLHRPTSNQDQNQPQRNTDKHR